MLNGLLNGALPRMLVQAEVWQITH